MDKREELREYLRTLLFLEERGYNCKEKVEQALNALHREMGFAIVEKERFKWEGIPNSVMVKIEKDLTSSYNTYKNVNKKDSDNPFNIFG